MKKLPLVLFALVTVFGWGGSIACAQMYFSGNVGAVWVDDADAYDGYDTAEISFDSGFATTAAFGFAYGYGLRTEFELGYRLNDLDEISVRGYWPEPISGDVSTFSAMGNVLFDLMPGYPVNPFIGAGIGLANIEGDIDYYVSDDDTVLAYQFMAGVSIALNYNMKIDFQYRFFGTDDPEFGYIEAEYNTHSVMAGLRLSFYSRP